MTGIYKITHLPTGQVYIGQSEQIFTRWYTHSQQKDKDWHADLREHPENYTFQIVEICEKEQLNEREAAWIKKENSYLEGLNRTCGTLMTDEEERARISGIKQREKTATKQKQIVAIAEKYAGLPLIGHIKDELLEECKPFLRTANGGQKFDLRLVLSEVKAQGFEVKRGKIGKKHIKEYGLPENLLRQDFQVILPKGEI